MGKTDRLLEQGEGHYSKGDYDNALRLFDQVLNREPANPEALKYKAIIKLRKDREEAAAFLRSAVERCEDDELYQMLGALYLDEKPDESLSFLLRSVDLNSDNTEAHYGLGILYASQKNDHEKAVQHFSRTLSGNPEHADACFNRGCSYMILHRMEKAEKDLKIAAEHGHQKAQEMLREYF